MCWGACDLATFADSGPKTPSRKIANLFYSLGVPCDLDHPASRREALGLRSDFATLRPRGCPPASRGGSAGQTHEPPDGGTRNLRGPSQRSVSMTLTTTRWCIPPSLQVRREFRWHYPEVSMNEMRFLRAFKECQIMQGVNCPQNPLLGCIKPKNTKNIKHFDVEPRRGTCPIPVEAGDEMVKTAIFAQKYVFPLSPPLTRGNKGGI